MDEEEDREFGDSNGYEMDEKAMEKLKELKKKRKENKEDKIRRIVEKEGVKFESRVEKMKESKASKVSITDPECRFMRSRGLNLCYNAQISVDSETGIIVARDVVNDEFDHYQLIPQLEQVKVNLRYPDEITADNGYYSGENLVYLAEKGIEAYIPDENTAIAIRGIKNLKDHQKEKLKYNAEKDYFECEYGKITFRYKYYDKSKKRDVWIYKGENCQSCPIQKECVKNKKGVKVIKCFFPEKIRVEMLNKMRSEEGKKKYKLRRKLEKVFSIKHNLGLRQFLTRGLERVKIEFDLACIAHNLRRIWSITGG